MIRPSCARTIRPKSEGAGKAGCPLHPQPRVQSVESTRVRHHRSTGTPGLPCAMVLTVSFALSPVIGLFCHRHLADTSAKLDASVEASGPHDFAVRKPTPSSEALPASTASRPAFMTIASRPSVGRDGERYAGDLGQRDTKIFLQGGTGACPQFNQMRAATKWIAARKFRAVLS